MVEARQGLEPVAGVVAGGRLSIAPMQHGNNNGGEEEEEESHEQITPPPVLTLVRKEKLDLGKVYGNAVEMGQI